MTVEQLAAAIRPFLLVYVWTPHVHGATYLPVDKRAVATYLLAFRSSATAPWVATERDGRMYLNSGSKV